MLTIFANTFHYRSLTEFTPGSHRVHTGFTQGSHRVHTGLHLCTHWLWMFFSFLESYALGFWVKNTQWKIAKIKNFLCCHSFEFSLRKKCPYSELFWSAFYRRDCKTLTTNHCVYSVPVKGHWFLRILTLYTKNIESISS